MLSFLFDGMTAMVVLMKLGYKNKGVDQQNAPDLGKLNRVLMFEQPAPKIEPSATIVSALDLFLDRAERDE